MSTPTPQSPFNPSRQVERIREILVGRQLATVERRLDRLEHRVAPPRSNGHGGAPQSTPLATRAPVAVRQLESAIAQEARRRKEAVATLGEQFRQRIEALDRNIDARPPAIEIDERFASLHAEMRQFLEGLRRELQQETRERSSAVHQLAGQISRVAALRTAERDPGDGQGIVRLRAAIEDWQRRLADNLEDRERWLIGQFRAELERLRRETWHWLGELHRTKVDRQELAWRIAEQHLEHPTRLDPDSD